MDRLETCSEEDTFNDGCVGTAGTSRRVHCLIRFDVDSVYIMFFLSFSCCMDEACHSSLRCTATFVIFSITPCCWPFLSNFLLPLPFLGLSSSIHPILIVVLLFSATLFLCPALFGNVSSFFMTM